jgi:hypothetical protein
MDEVAAINQWRRLSVLSVRDLSVVRLCPVAQANDDRVPVD